ncbi:hypothetical protein DSO57_1007409 [Entomophthora muscae]|uniref:Uncharacterized protein n=1 Tax=Entomophthora muscae TaxID=34485 RepID=A0ACC2SKF8_9FUNG|nr:hypothetical protein DSO57_1007409 [Entomophthora muscae]
MILPVLKFVMFPLAPLIILLWTTAPDLWLPFSTSSCLVGNNPSSFLHLPGELLVLGEKIVKSLTCDNLEFSVEDYAVPAPALEVVLASPVLSLDKENPALLLAPVGLPPAPTCTPWLITGLVLMGLNAYFPQLSPVFSLWSPLQAAIPVLHWAASWWFILPGWEPNLVSLDPLSHTKSSSPPLRKIYIWIFMHTNGHYTAFRACYTSSFVFTHL